MSNKDFYRQTFSAVRPSDEAIEGIREMTAEKKRGIRLAPVLALAACVVLVLTAAIGTNAITMRMKPMDNSFSLSVYAMDKKGNVTRGEDIVRDGVFQSNTKLTFKWESEELTGSDCAVYTDYDTGFYIESDYVESVTYSCDSGCFNYQNYADDSGCIQINECTPDDEGTPYATSITVLYPEGREAHEVYYYPKKAIDTLLKTKNDDYTRLEGDTIKISVKLRSGEIVRKSIKTSFDKGGYMQMEYK